MMAGKKRREGRTTVVLNVLSNFVRKLKTRAREGDQAGFYKFLETMNKKRSETTARRTSKTWTIYS